MKSKIEIGELVSYFCTLVRNQFNSTIKIFRSDNGTEFVNSALKDLFRNFKILHQTFCVNTP